MKSRPPSLFPAASNGSATALAWPALALAAVAVLAVALGVAETQQPWRTAGSGPPAVGAAATPTAAVPPVDPARLATSALFGRYDPAAAVADEEAGAAPPAPATTPEGAPGELPEATIGWQVAGILHTAEEADRRAILAQGGDEPAAYAIGATLPGGTAIRFIEARRVVVEVDGRLEALSLPDETLTPATPAAGVAADGRAAPLPQPVRAGSAAGPGPQSRIMALRRRAQEAR